MKQLSLTVFLLALAMTAAADTQSVRITNLQQGKRFDGIGAVNGGGATSDHYKKGMAGLLAPLQKKRVCTPYFDNLSIKPLGRNNATQPLAAKDHRPMYPQR